MGADQEDPRVDLEVIVFVRVQAFVEPYQLTMECHVRVRYLPPLPNMNQRILHRYLLREYHVANNHSTRPRNTLDAVDEDAAAVGLRLADEVDHFVEAALDVLAHVVLEVQGEVFDAAVDVVVGGIISSTINNMRDAILLEFIEVFGHLVAAEVQEVVQDARADAVEQGILILLPRSATLVKVNVHWCLLILLSSSRCIHRRIALPRRRILQVQPGTNAKRRLPLHRRVFEA